MRVKPATTQRSQLQYQLGMIEDLSSGAPSQMSSPPSSPQRTQDVFLESPAEMAEIRRATLVILDNVLDLLNDVPPPADDFLPLPPNRTTSQGGFQERQ